MAVVCGVCVGGKVVTSLWPHLEAREAERERRVWTDLRLVQPSGTTHRSLEARLNARPILAPLCHHDTSHPPSFECFIDSIENFACIEASGSCRVGKTTCRQ
eukprot:SAG11_NODE_103_length_16571_cov_49.569208_10_plen_102_part_00